jgi:DNA-binding HxlR family transcriptional regulator
MRRKTFAHMNCSIARALEQIGEWWTFLIVREALMGTRRFDKFQSNLGIARNILAARLKKLVARGILERTVASDDARRVEYRMTEKGRALFPVLMALREWGDQWVVGPGRVPVIVVDRVNAQPIEVRVTNRDGRPTGWLDARMIPGPGAQAALKRRLARVRKPAASLDRDGARSVSAKAAPGAQRARGPHGTILPDFRAALLTRANLRQSRIVTEEGHGKHPL